LVDARRDFSKLRVINLAPVPVAPARSFEPGYGSL
jgi:hypothetical protein